MNIIRFIEQIFNHNDPVKHCSLKETLKLRKDPGTLEHILAGGLNDRKI